MKARRLQRAVVLHTLHGLVLSLAFAGIASVAGTTTGATKSTTTPIALLDLAYLDKKDIGFEPVSGGLSNRNFKLRIPSSASDWHFIVRIPGDLSLPPEHNYSRIHLVNRSMEARCARAASVAGVSPELIEYNGTSGVMLTRWLDGSVLTDKSLLTHIVTVARALRRFHDSVNLELPAGTRRFSALERANNYLSLSNELSVELPSSVAAVFQAARAADAALQKVPSVAATALHCDLIPANFIVTPPTTADVNEKLWIFDFEYCHFGDRVWDLANFIAFNKLNKGDRIKFLSAYGPVDDVLLESKLTVMMWLFTVSEGMWGIVQHSVSDLPFEADWAEGIASFREYGLQLLDSAALTLAEDSTLSSALDQIHRTAGTSSEAARQATDL